MITGNPVQSTAQAQDNLRIQVFPGADADFILYEDDGVSYDYEAGEFATVALHWDNASRTLSIGQRSGSFPGMSSSKTLTVTAADEKCAARKIIYTGDAAKIQL